MAKKGKVPKGAFGGMLDVVNGQKKTMGTGMPKVAKIMKRVMNHPLLRIPNNFK